MEPAECHALLHLISIGGDLAPRRRLLERAGSACAARAAGLQRWRESGLSHMQCEALRVGWTPPHVLQRWCDASVRHHIVGWHDADYPPLLREIPGPPLALFVIGDPLRLWHPALAVVGSRMPSAGGRSNAGAFSGAVARTGLGVVSGLAAGVDGAAHRAALDAGGLTVAVLGAGIDTPYPQGHAGLYREIGRCGVVVSEYPPGTPARRGNFPARNRIIAGLSLGTLVVEAAQRSGALITARLAAEAGREVFAIPGSIHNPMAKGCHRLLRQGAMLVETPAELIDALTPLATQLGQTIAQRLQVEPAIASCSAAKAVETAETVETACILQALGHDPVGFEQLSERTGLSAAALSSALLGLELAGRVVAAHGRYCRTC